MMLKLLPLLLLLSSCSYFIAKIDTPLVDEKEYTKKTPEVETFCRVEEAPKLQLVGSNAHAQATYKDLSDKIGRKLDVFDHFALWSLVQLSVRPDQSSATARYQVLFHHAGKSFYFDFFSESTDNQYPYLYGVEWILKKFGKKESLESYAALLQNHGHQFKLGKNLEEFLKKNQAAIKASEELSPYYFRGSEILKEEESTPKLNYPQIIAFYRKAKDQQKIVVNTYLTPFTSEKGHKGSCNYDFNLYNNSIFLIDKTIPEANLFGLALPDSGFMASSSQKMEGVTSLNKTSLFKGDSKVRSSAVCVIESADQKIWTFSNKSRDPGQHLFHLVRYGLPATHSTSEVDRLIRHSRHLFLSDPVRLVIESNRSRRDQIDNLLKLNLPIYNAEKLGNIWAYTFFAGQSRFVIDDRNHGHFLCK